MKWKEYEAKWQQRWDEAGVFVPQVEDSKRPKFFVTVPYPYTSGALHIGHGRTFTTGDVVARFKRHRGFNVLFPMAFHISGSPILSISDKIAHEDVKTINLYKRYLEIYEKDLEKIDGIIESFKDPEKVAEYFAGKINLDFKSVGYSIDWTRQFDTGQPHYNKFIEWQFHKFKETGILVKGSHPILWSLKNSQPLGEDDISDGDVDKVSISEFTLIKFEGEDGFFVAATLRPETLFGATNLWINPDVHYVVADVNGERWVVSEEAVGKLGVQGGSVKVVKKERGRVFLGKTVSDPLGRQLPVLPAGFVDPDNGTGVVYSVPAHAPYDYQALVDLKRDAKFGPVVSEIEPVVIISIPGYEVPAREICERMGIRDQRDSRLEEATQEIYKAEFYTGVLNDKCERFSGMLIQNIKDEVKKWLKQKGASGVFYETSRKAVSRGGDKVVVAVLDNQWFIDYNHDKWKAKTRKHLAKMVILPEKFRKLFENTVEWLDKRPCARRRGLGTRFPFDKEWVIESLSDSTIYMAFYVLIPYLQGVAPEKLKPEVFDFLLLGEGDAEKVAKLTGLSVEKVNEARKAFEYWYPNDLRHTAPAHIGNHLTFFIMHHLAIFPEKLAPPCITLNEMLIREGAKMSKSKGNVIPLNHVKEKYGADLYRMYVVSSADLDTVVDWREKDVGAVQRKLEKFVEIMDRCSETTEREVVNEIDRWMLSRFNRSLKVCTENMEAFRFREAVVEMFFKLLNDVRWFERRSEEPYGLLRKIAKDWLVSLAPVIPHTAEEYWEKLGGGESGFVSLAKWPEANEKIINSGIEKSEDFVQGVMEDIRSMIKMAGHQPGRIYLYTAEDWKWKALELVVKEKQGALKHARTFKDPAEAAKTLASFVKNRVWENGIERLDEASIIAGAEKILKEEFGAEVVVNDNHDPMNKKGKAMPFRPAVYLE
ncbi:MAG TPA: leucine--tRNA ligase [archaeon]|nr:leucine--tRNA ligase [archaeon]